jgi:hypothetical protein
MSARKRSAFDVFGADALEFLDEAGVPTLIIGGLAVIAVGEPRLTGDVDVIAYVSGKRARLLIREAKDAGFELDEALELDRLSETGTLCFRRPPFHLDVITASLPFEDSARRRARDATLFGRRVKMPTPEDLLVLKLAAARPKDLLDAEGVARRHWGRIDTRYLEDTLRELCDLAEDTSLLRRWEDLAQRIAGVQKSSPGATPTSPPAFPPSPGPVPALPPFKRARKPKA